jgi:hypothetical protein
MNENHHVLRLISTKVLLVAPNPIQVSKKIINIASGIQAAPFDED